MILIIQGRRIYQPSYVCGFHHVTAVPHILEEVALSLCCSMFLLLACDDEKFCYRKYTAQHSKRLESEMNYLSVFECFILLVSFPLIILFCRRKTCCKIFVFTSKLVEYIKISQKAVTAFFPIDAKIGGHFGLPFFYQKFI